MNGHNTAAFMHLSSPENKDQLFIREESAGLSVLTSCLREKVL